MSKPTDRINLKTKRRLDLQTDDVETPHSKRNKSTPVAKVNKGKKLKPSKLLPIKMGTKSQKSLPIGKPRMIPELNINENRSKRLNHQEISNIPKDKKVERNVTKVIPIIQTHGMKAKNAKNALDTQKEILNLNRIDHLSSVEFVDGENALNDDTVVDHDGVELSIDGSDLDEQFPENEPGEIPSSDSEDETETVSTPQVQPKKRVKSKVIKVNKNAVAQQQSAGSSDGTCASAGLN